MIVQTCWTPSYPNWHAETCQEPRFLEEMKTFVSSSDAGFEGIYGHWLLWRCVILCDLVFSPKHLFWLFAFWHILWTFFLESLRVEYQLDKSLFLYIHPQMFQSMTLLVGEFKSGHEISELHLDLPWFALYLSLCRYLSTLSDSLAPSERLEKSSDCEHVEAWPEPVAWYLDRSGPESSQSSLLDVYGSPERLMGWESQDDGDEPRGASSLYT